MPERGGALVEARTRLKTRRTASKVYTDDISESKSSILPELTSKDMDKDCRALCREGYELVAE